MPAQSAELFLPWVCPAPSLASCSSQGHWVRLDWGIHKKGRELGRACARAETETGNRADRGGEKWGDFRTLESEAGRAGLPGQPGLCKAVSKGQREGAFENSSLLPLFASHVLLCAQCLRQCQLLFPPVFGIIYFTFGSPLPSCSCVWLWHSSLLTCFSCHSLFLSVCPGRCVSLVSA